MDAVTVCLQKVIRHPHDPDLQFELATLYFNDEQYAQAFTHFLRCTDCTRDPTLISECLLSGSKVMCKHEDRSSKEYGLILHSLSMGPKNPEPYYVKSMYHSWRGEWIECYTVTCLALATLDSFEPTFRNQDFFQYYGYTDLLYQKALSAYHVGKYDETRRVYTAILDTHDITDTLRTTITEKLTQFPLLQTSPIPKKIFQTWETSKNEISPGLQHYIDSWREHNPDYELHFYNKTERYEFIEKHFDANVLDAYSRLKPGAFKCDLWRYCVLYTHGGFYADIDIECLSSLDTLCDNSTQFICPIDLNPNTNCKYNLSNGFIGSIPKHPLLKRCIDHVVDVLKSQGRTEGIFVTNITGTGCLGINMNKYLNLEWDSGFVGKEGIVNNTIKLIKFEEGTEYMYDISNKINILQNKNGNPKIQKAYKYECSKITDHVCFGKFGEYTEIGNIVDYNTSSSDIPTDQTVF